MADKTNSHVERLHKFLPLSPDHNQIFEEYAKQKDALSLDTKALDYLLEAAGKGATFVILTGDAGHGKTHLCRRLLEKHLGFEEADARVAINEKCDGSIVINPVDDRVAIPLRVFKDFSEPTVDAAARYLEDIDHRTGELNVVCANEGRLRAILKSDSAGEVCMRLHKLFQDSFQNGLASCDGKMHIVNLNYQSVASAGKSLAESAMHKWLGDGKWKACKGCDSREHCPIYHNRNLLADKKRSHWETRRSRIVRILETVERLGVVVTIRDMLMLVAYMITGGLRCTDVHAKKVKHGQKGWQHDYAFYNLLFVRPNTISKEQLATIPVLQHISPLDPGMHAPRTVDERLVNKGGEFREGELDLLFTGPETKTPIDAANGIDEILGNPRSRNERLKEAEFVQKVVRSVRRRTFFEDKDNGTSILARIRFEYGFAFQEIVDGSVEPARMAKLKGLIVSGLHVMQGLQMTSSEMNLHLVDPAFGNTSSHAAIIACRISSKDIKLLPMKKAWDIDTSREHVALTNACDWLDRCVVLRLHTSESDFRDLHLDLLMFECIARAGAGYVAEDFYAHDIRKVTNFLGRIAEKAIAADGEILLFLDRRLRNVAIDNGVIQVGGGN